MASRKDFVQRSRKKTPASTSQPVATPRAKATPPPKRKPWAAALFSLVALAGLIFVLNQLLNVDPAHTTNNASSSKPVQVKPAQVKPVQATPIAEKKPLAVVNATAPKVVEKPAKEEAAIKEKKYEFYELLPKSEIQPAAVKEYKSTPRDTKLAKQYVLQAGSFRNAVDAERMRAQLLLSGLSNVYTSESHGSNGLWYRVRLGPFDNRSVMNKAHDKLARMNINPMAIRID